MKLTAYGDSGITIYATIRKLTNAGAFGDWWNNVSEAWETNPSTADRKVSLTEDGTTGAYSGGTATLDSSYTGFISVRYHDDVDDTLLSGADFYLVNGDEVRLATTNDLDAIPSAIRSELYTNPVPASNMRGTDDAFLAASWIAPNNSTINSNNTLIGTVDSNVTTLLTEMATTKAAAQSVDGKLPAGTSALISNIDVAVSTRSSHSAADVRTELNNNPVPASNMRGTDNAFLAASWIAPDNTNIGLAKTAAEAAQTASEALQTNYTPTRAAKLDFLVGTVATSAEVSGISNVVKARLVGAFEIQLPTSGSTPHRLTLHIYDSNGALNDPDATPVFTAFNQSGTDRSTNLGTVTKVANGKYYVDYSVADTHAEEQVTVFAAWDENSVATTNLHTFSVVAVATGSGFTSSDRTKLNAVHGKLPSRAYFAGTDAADGDINVDNFDGDITAFHADQTSVINAARDAVIAQGDAAWTTATVILAGW